MHEVKPRSLGGTISIDNSIACCGSGTTGCHGFAQRHEFEQTDRRQDSQGNGRVWTPMTKAARAWLEASP
jgi:hypothetical protein